MTENNQNEILPIREINEEARMKNISHTSLPHFYGLTFEDTDTFMFDFIVFCRTYDYAYYEKKMKFFPSILKGETL